MRVLACEAGFESNMTTVTVIGCEAPHNINNHESLRGEGILTTIAGTMATTGNNDTYYDAQPLVVLGPEHAQTIAKDGYPKADVKRFCKSTRRCL